MERPELVLFDLGNVIVRVDIMSVAARLGETSEEPRYQDPMFLLSSVREEMAPLLSGFDTGKVSGREFYETLASAYRLKLDYFRFVDIWNSGFHEDYAVSSFVEQLTRRCRVFLLSNTNPLHFEYLRSACSVIGSMEACIVSYRVGYQKPAAEIYQHALESAGLTPRQTWYVDDMPEFVGAAANLGIHSIQFQSASQLRDEMGSLLE